MFGLFNLIKGFFEFVTSVIQFVIKLIGDLVYIVGLIGQAIIKIPSYIGFLPASVIAVFLTGLTIIVVYKIAGRD